MRPSRNASSRTEEEGNQRKKILKKLKGNYVDETGRRLDDHLNVHQLDVFKKKVAPLLPSRFSSRDHRL